MRKHILLKQIILSLILCTLSETVLIAQDAIGSIFEEYHDHLVLIGKSSYPYLNYSSLSDNIFNLNDGNSSYTPLVQSAHGNDEKSGSYYFLYGPEIFTSYNTALPYGMNDGALWQGVGFNTKITTGIRLHSSGLELTIKPEFLFEENEDFRILDSVYPDSGGYGYFWFAGVDLPQRMGAKPRTYFNWGDTEVRYTWKFFTAGFGTQAVWIGPGKVNAIILSNNAPSFPKFDIGFRKLTTRFGDFEGRVFWGYLTESQYFDEEETNNNNLLNGISISYAPFFERNLSLGFHRTLLTKWRSPKLNDTAMLFIPAFGDQFAGDGGDQRASLSLNWLFPESGFEWWIEWARNDFSPEIDYVIRYPFHSQAYTVGIRKAFSLQLFGRPDAEILAEVTNLESSRDYEFISPYYFYGHHEIIQGYTNEGQILGAGIQGGSNSQYLALKLFYPKTFLRFFLQRSNKDNDYVYFLHHGQQPTDKRNDEYKISTILSVGGDIEHLIDDWIIVGTGFTYSAHFNPFYNPDDRMNTLLNNFHITATCTFILD